MLAKTTMTAVNGKPVSVRTFKLSNAVKQSLVASKSKSVAVAAVAAYQVNGNVDHEKLIATTAPACPIVNGNSPSVTLVNGSHQTPTSLTILNGTSASSSKSLATSSMASVLTTNHCSSSSVTSTTNNLVNGTTTNTSNGIFKTPLTPKLAQSPIASFTNQTPTTSSSVSSSTQSHMFVVDLMPKNNQSQNVRPTPILANSAKLPNANTNNNTTTNNNGRKPKQNGNKRQRTNSKNNDNLYSNQLLSTAATYGDQLMVSNGQSPKCRLNSPISTYDNSNDDSNYSFMYSSPLDNDSSSDLFESSSYYDTSSSYSYNNNQCSSTNEFISNRRSGARTRQETSLGQLTRKFIELLENSSDGSINLNEASNFLKVQKRRIYDITNVLEGVGLLHKTSKNNIQWRGSLVDYLAGKDCTDFAETSHYRNRKPPPLSLLFGDNKTVGLNQTGRLKESTDNLENDENRLDNLLKLANENLTNIKNNSSAHLYVRCLDLRRVPDFKGQTVIGIRPPLDTMLEVSDPSEVFEYYYYLFVSYKLFFSYLFRVCKFS